METQRIINEAEYERLLSIEKKISELVAGKVKGFKLRHFYAHMGLPSNEYILSEDYDALLKQLQDARVAIRVLGDDLLAMQAEKPKDSFFKKLQKMFT